MDVKDVKDVKDETTKDLSRRKFLRGAGVSLAGAALLGGMSVLTGCNNETTADSGGGNAGSGNAAQWPFEYAKLDPDEAAQLAYDGYKEDG